MSETPIVSPREPEDETVPEATQEAAEVTAPEEAPAPEPTPAEEDAPVTEEEAPAAVEEDAPVTEDAPSPAPAPAPRPPAGPRPPVRKVAPPKEVPMDPHDAAEAAQWGRVEDDGTVLVRESSGERVVGQFPDVAADEALAFYVRRFLDLVAQVKLFESRLAHISTKEIDQTLKSLKEQVAEPQAVGDLEGLRQRLALAEERAIERRSEIQAEREAAKAAAFEAREDLVAGFMAVLIVGGFKPVQVQKKEGPV